MVLPRQSVIRFQGTEDRAAYFLAEGWVASSMLLAGGERQILKLHLPGDMLGSTSMCLDQAIDTLTALTPVTVRKIPSAGLGRLLATNSRIAMFMLLSAQKERVGLMDLLASNSRTSPTARLAFLLLNLHHRLSIVGQSRADEFEVAINQEQLGDIVGLTPVHVNRVLRQLGDDGMIERHRRRIRILDFERLTEIAEIPLRKMSADPTWLDSSVEF